MSDSKEKDPVTEQLKDSNFVALLLKADMPGGLVRKTPDEHIPMGEMRDKFSAVRKAIKEDGHWVILVAGADSPFKDDFCAALMKWFMLVFNKTGKWVTPVQLHSLLAENLVGAAGVTVVTAVDLLNHADGRGLAAAVREKVPLGGKLFVLCATDREALEAVLGKSFFDYISHLATIVTIPSERSPIVEV